MGWRTILGGRKDGWGRRIWGVVLIVAAFGALVLAVGLYARFGFGTPAGISSGSMKPHTNFNVFWHSARALWDGRNIYYGTGGPDVSAQSPLWTVLVSPLALLELLTAYRAFVVISLAINVGYLAWTADVLELRVGWAVVVAGALLVSSPLLGTLALGQIYPIETLCLVAAWVAGPRATLDWLVEVSGRQPDGWWYNASLPGSAARLFRENQFAEPIATLP